MNDIIKKYNVVHWFGFISGKGQVVSGGRFCFYTDPTNQSHVAPKNILVSVYTPTKEDSKPFKNRLKMWNLENTAVCFNTGFKVEVRLHI